MSSDTNIDVNANSSNDSITVIHQRERDGRRKITAILPGGETFVRAIWLQEKQERDKFLNEICAEMPGIGVDERQALRDELLRIKRETEVDLEINCHGPVNGRAIGSVHFYQGSAVKFSDSGNLFDAKFRNRVAQPITDIVAGPKAPKGKRSSVLRRVVGRLMSEVTRIRDMPPVTVKPSSSFSREVVPYSFDEQGINWLTKTREGQDVVKPLTNFTAKITAEVTRDDGSGDPELEFELEVHTGKPEPQRIAVKASKFAEMNWPLEKLGTRGLVYAGQGAKDHARAAILWLSANPPRKHVRTHTGWVKAADGSWLFLHAGGAIGADRAEPVHVALDGALSSYALPAPPTDPIALKAAIRSSLRLLELGPADIVFPPYCALWRSILGRCNFAVHLVGRSGVFKSELAALIQQHLGQEMHALNLPAAWRSTDNALGELLFLAKDVLCTIDDFKPLGTQQDVQKWHAKADNVFRGQGNGAGKQRMRADGGLRVTKPPRGTVLSTGEQIPRGESCRARMLIVQVSPDDIEGGEWLGSFQKEAAEGLYASATAAFIRWLASDARIDRARGEMRDAIPKLRDRAQSSELHKRTPEIAANLYVGLLYWLEFAAEKGAITQADVKRIQDEAWSALGRTAEQQLDHQSSSEPATRYLELLMSAIASGNAHLAGLDGNCPGEAVAAACGWRRRFERWEPQGSRIGWIEDVEVYLEPDAAYRAAQDAAGSAGAAPIDSERELRKRLEEKGLLRMEGNGDRFNRRATRKLIEGARRWVISLAPGALPLCARAARATDNSSEQVPTFFDQK